MTRSESLQLSDKEMEQVRLIARRDGRPAEEVATELVQAAISRRMRKRTGKGPAKVYGMRRKTTGG